MNQLIESIESEQLKTDIPDFKVGDVISAYYRIIEGDKERVQVFTGTVIARKGKGISETISIYRIAYGSAMERVLLLNSPRISRIEVVKRGKVRKGKLYYLRGRFGKRAKVKEMLKREDKKAVAQEAPSQKELPKPASQESGETKSE